MIKKVNGIMLICLSTLIYSSDEIKKDDNDFFSSFEFIQHPNTTKPVTLPTKKAAAQEQEVLNPVHHQSPPPFSQEELLQGSKKLKPTKAAIKENNPEDKSLNEEMKLQSKKQTFQLLSSTSQEADLTPPDKKIPPARLSVSQIIIKAVTDCFRNHRN